MKRDRLSVELNASFYWRWTGVCRRNVALKTQLQASALSTDTTTKNIKCFPCFCLQEKKIFFPSIFFLPMQTSCWNSASLTRHDAFEKLVIFDMRWKIFSSALNYAGKYVGHLILLPSLELSCCTHQIKLSLIETPHQMTPRKANFSNLRDFKPHMAEFGKQL